MRTHVSILAIAAAMGFSAAALAQSPPPVEPAPGASLLVTATNPADKKLTVTTPGWKNGEDIAFKYTQYQGNTFPGLEWTKGPASTKSYAVIMQDSAFVMRGSPILHWSIVNIPASTTKLLTGLIVAESGNLDRAVTVAQVDTFAEPVKLNIKPGEIYQRIDLLRALLVKSPNDVARCLARDNAGSIEAFAERMNERAAAVGATHSHFVNPNGLPAPGQYSTARDIARVARYAYFNPTIRNIVGTQTLHFQFADGRIRDLKNTNKILGANPYCNGMKTGYTNAAGHCLVASGNMNGQHVIAVLMASRKAVWNDANNLLNWALGAQ